MTDTAVNPRLDLCVSLESLHRLAFSDNLNETARKYMFKSQGKVEPPVNLATPISLSKVLELDGLDHTLSCFPLTLENSDQFAMSLACDYAEHVLQIFEAQYPRDERLYEYIRIARLFASGETTEDQFREAASGVDRCVSNVIEAIQSSGDPSLVAYPFPFFAAVATSELYALNGNVCDGLLTVAKLGRTALACATRLVKAHELPPIGMSEDREPHVLLLSEAEASGHFLEEKWQIERLMTLFWEACAYQK